MFSGPKVYGKKNSDKFKIKNCYAYLTSQTWRSNIKLQGGKKNVLNKINYFVWVLFKDPLPPVEVTSDFYFYLFFLNQQLKISTVDESRLNHFWMSKTEVPTVILRIYLNTKIKHINNLCCCYARRI